jgi:hypothetical protein
MPATQAWQDAGESLHFDRLVASTCDSLSTGDMSVPVFAHHLNVTVAPSLQMPTAELAIAGL